MKRYHDLFLLGLSRDIETANKYVLPLADLGFRLNK